MDKPKKPRLYLETTIPSYLTARQSRDIIQAARQQITIEWWDNRLNDFDIFISPVVIEEVGAGDPEAARKRLEAIQSFPLLEITEEVIELSEKILQKKLIPEKGARDSLHIAIAVCHEMKFLLTWNFTHIANAERIGLIQNMCIGEGYEFPVICTPEELLERM